MQQSENGNNNLVSVTHFQVAYQNGLTIREIFLILLASTSIYIMNTVLIRRQMSEQKQMEAATGTRKTHL